MRLRQLALAAEALEPTVEALCDVFAIDVSLRDPGVALFGLENAVMPIGDTFLEVVSPKEADTSAGRFLARRGGDGGYMVILQTEDLEAHRKRLDELSIRIVWETRLDDIATLHLHPRDVGGAILSLDEADPPSSWRWAGPWEEHRRTERVQWLAGAEMQAEDPAALCQRWSQAVESPVIDPDDGSYEIALDAGRLRFVPARDGRGDGLSGIEVLVRDPAPVLDAAGARGLPVDGESFELGGVRFDLVQGARD